MTPADAAWVRDNAWTPQMRRQPYMMPDGSCTYDHALAASLCDCMGGVCPRCLHGRHDLCERRKIRPRPECWIKNLPLDYIRPTAVWYRDRACRSLCPCCPAGPPLRFELVPLFDLVGSPA